MVRTPSLSFFVALACVFLVLVSSPAAAAGRSPPLPQSQANPKTFTAPSWSMATGPSAAPPNLRPIVGIFTLANSDKPTETASTIPATYVKWLEQSGARVAVIPFNAPHPVLDQLFNGINALLFTGGGLSLDADTPYFQNALYLFQKAMAANDRGDFFPIWGTCQGFQLMHLLAALPANHTDILKCELYDSTNYVIPLDFHNDAPSSLLFGPSTRIKAFVDGSSDETIYQVYAKRNVTMNLHNCGVSPSDFHTDPILPTFYYPLSSNVDKKGLPFISTIQGIRYPFFAVQWHPERTQFEWDPAEVLNHEDYSIHAHSYLSQRLMTFVRLSQHHFVDRKSERAALIYQYVPKYTGGDTDNLPDKQTYEFNFKF